MAPTPLTALQIEASRLFFTLPESAGFAVAGGAALLAQGLIHRPTVDVDLPTSTTLRNATAVTISSPWRPKTTRASTGRSSPPC